MNTWKLILATVVIFTAGALTGGLLVRYSETARASLKAEPANGGIHSTNAPREYKIPAPLLGPLRKDFVDKLQKELKIDAGQRERIERIICDGQETTRLIWLEVEPDIFHTIVETKDKIRTELTPEQLEKFEALLKPKSKAPQPAPNVPPAVLTNTVPARP